MPRSAQGVRPSAVARRPSARRSPGRRRESSSARRPPMERPTTATAGAAARSSVKARSAEAYQSCQRERALGETAGVAGEARDAHDIAAPGEVLAEELHLERAAGEAVQEEDAGRAHA